MSKPLDVWDNSIHRLSTYCISHLFYSATEVNKTRNPSDNGAWVLVCVGCLLYYLNAGRISWPWTTALLNRDRESIANLDLNILLNEYILAKVVAYLIPHYVFLYRADDIIQFNVWAGGLVGSRLQKLQWHHEIGYYLYNPCLHGEVLHVNGLHKMMPDAHDNLEILRLYDKPGISLGVLVGRWN